MKKFTLRTAAIAGVLALSLTACGGDDEAEADVDAYVDAMTKSWAAAGNGVSEAKARCWSEKFVDVVGEERLQGTGTPNQFASQVTGLDYTDIGLTAGEGGRVYENFGSCGIDLRQNFIDGVAESEEFPAEARQCVEDGLTEEMMRDFTVRSMTKGAEGMSGGEVDEESPEAVMMSCLFGIDPAQL